MACSSDQEEEPALTPELDALFGTVDARPSGASALGAQTSARGTLILVGLVDALEHYSLYFDVPGTVAEVRVQEGQRVSRGQSMARLDTEALQAQIREVEGRLRAARSSVPAARRRREGQGPAPDYLLREMRRQKEAMDAQSGQRARDLARLKHAYREGGWRAVARRAEAQHQRNYRLPSQEALARAAKDRLVAELVDDLEGKRAQLRYLLTESVLKSPVSGQVHLVGIKPGDPFSPRTSEAAFVVLDDSALALRVLVPQAAADALQVGQGVPVELPDGLGEAGTSLVRAQVEEIGEEPLSVEDGKGGFADHLRVSLRLPRNLRGRITIGEELRVGLRP